MGQVTKKVKKINNICWMIGWPHFGTLVSLIRVQKSEYPIFRILVQRATNGGEREKSEWYFAIFCTFTNHWLELGPSLYPRIRLNKRYTLTHTHTLLSHYHIRTHTHSLSLSLSHTQTHTLFLTLSHTHTHTRSL